ncbi:MAG: hypothetical protein R3329_14600, partial [Pseudoalteromonas tetraodonis]|nr:hypothetical protein [Pseudoalteromonas tetraodonis]
MPAVFQPGKNSHLEDLRSVFFLFSCEKKFRNIYYSKKGEAFAFFWLKPVMFSKALRNPRVAFVIAAAALAVLLIVELVLFALNMSSHRRDQETAFRMLTSGGTCDKTGAQLIQEGLVENCGRQIVIRDKAPATAAAEKFAARYAISNLLNTTAENFGKIFLLVLLSG